MYRVSDVLKPDFARSWHEAVAVVQEVASQLVPGAGVPDADDLLLEQNGTLQLGFAPDSPGDPVSALGLLLQSLLTGVEAPGGLRELADGNAKRSPTHSSVASFQKALAFYERPVRSNDLAAMAGRLGGGPAPKADDPEAEFERLKEKLAARAEVAEDGKPAADGPKRARRQMPRQMLIGIGVLALAIVGAIVVYARPRYLAAPTQLTDRVEQKLADTISSGLDKMGMASDATRVPAATLPAEAPEAGRGGASHAAGSTAATSGTSARKAHVRTPTLTPVLNPVLTLKGQLPATGSDVPEFLSRPDLADGDAHGSGTILESARADGGGLATYSISDRDVDPPRLTRPQLPRQPEPGDDTGYFDVIISEGGDVERVQLISPMRRFQERMLMAAAKAWKFTPATRNGLPVRYRMRIAIIISDKP